MSSAKALKLKILSIALSCAVLSGCAYRVKTETGSENDILPMASVDQAKTQGATTTETFYDAKLVKMHLPPSALENNMRLVTTISETPIILQNWIVAPVYRYYSEGSVVETNLGPNYTAVEFQYAVFNLDGEFVSYLYYDEQMTNDAIFCENKDGNIVAFYSLPYFDDVTGTDYYNIFSAVYSAYDGLYVEPPMNIYVDSACDITGALELDNGYILLSMEDQICIVDKWGEFYCGMSLLSDEMCAGLWEEGGHYYAEILSGTSDGKTGVLLELSVDPYDGSFFVSDTGKNTDNIAGMKVFQNSNGIYAATRNALGKLDLQTGEFSRLLDWNQTDADRRLIDKGNIRVLEEGSLSQTLTILPEVEGYADPAAEQYAISESDGRPVTVEETFVEASSPHQEETDVSTDEPGQTRLLIATTMNNAEGEVPCLLMLTPSQEHPHASQNVIWIGGVDISKDLLMKYISEYNQDPENSIWLKIYDYADFSVYGDVIETQRAYEAALENMASQIRSGIGPDIIVGAGDSGIFENGSCLTDLNGYVDGIHGIDRNLYFGSVFDAFETNGRLYQIPLSFQLYSILGNTVMADGKTSLDYHDYTAAQNIFQGEFSLFTFYPTSVLMSLFIKAETGTWIDYEHGTSNIDRDSLIGFLELVRANSQELGYSYLDDYMMFYEPSIMDTADALYYGNAGFAAGKITTISEFAVSHMREGTYEWYGLPGAGTTAMVRSDMTCGIASCSTQKELAWSVISYLLSEEVQKDIGKTVEYDWGMSAYQVSRFPMNVNAFIRNCDDLESGTSELSVCFYDIYGLGQPEQVSLNSVSKNRDIFINWMQKPLRRYIFDLDVVLAVFDETQKYLDGEVQVTQAADNIRRRLNVLASG